MFKWQHNILEGTELFPRTVQAPPILRIHIHPPPARPDYDYQKANLEQLGRQLLDKNRAKITQFALAQRAQARSSALPVYKAHREFPSVLAVYTRIQGTEQLDVTVYPVPPIKKLEDDLCLLVFHDQRKVTAIMMKELEADEVQGLTAKLTRELSSSWGEDLLKAAQYLFDKDDGGVAMSPVKIENNRVTRSETHCFVSVKAKFETFLDTSTLARRTPHINGGAQNYFTPNDKFEFTSSGLRYVGGYGQGDTPFAISSTGEYFYKFTISADTFVTSSSDPQEAHQLDELKTDAQIETIITSYEASYPSLTTGLSQRMSYLSNADQNVFLSGIFPLTSSGDAGYGVYVDTTYTPVYNYSSTGDAGSGFPAIDTDISTSMPMAVFSQQDGVDTLAVELVPVAASLSYANFGVSITSSVQFLHLDYTMVKPPGPYPSSPAANPYDSSLLSPPMYRTWSLTFPPSLSTELGQYYFADAGKIRTPYGDYDYSFTAPQNNHPYILRDKYKPWFHLSNGKTYLQAFQVNEERHVFCKSTEITQFLADACGTEIENIQGCLADFPLAKVRDLA